MAKGNMSLYHNGRFDMFRRKLDEEGVILKMLWDANSNRYQNESRKIDVACYAVVGAPDGGYRGTIMVVSYGDDGFATYWEPSSANMDDDVARIMGEQINGAQR